MRAFNSPIVKIAVLLLVLLTLATTVYAAGGGGLWLSGGQNRNNARHQKAESKIGPENVADLELKWSLNTG